ncbi:MAG: hypothetical protein PVG20_09260 [Thioalkalispiraceae bacterium]|jgi:hypothetical protein
MVKRLAIMIMGMFLISACATSGTEGPSLYFRIKSASHNIQVVSSKDADWCGPEKSCQYLGEVFCELDEYDKRDGKEKICKKKIFTKIVRQGGDTFVLQKKGNVSNTMDHYRIFGQAYNCSNTNQQLHKEYIAEENLKPLHKIKLVTEPYAKLCKTTAGCKENERKWSCGSIQGDPFKQCRRKFNRNSKKGSKINTIVYKSDRVNGAGVYRLYIDSYICK